MISKDQASFTAADFFHEHNFCVDVFSEALRLRRSFRSTETVDLAGGSAGIETHPPPARSTVHITINDKEKSQSD